MGEPAERLGALEAVIERGLETFVVVGNALREIRDSRLYREDYATFEDYCRERWRWGRSYANKQITAAETAALVGTNVPIANEAQARALAPLARVDPEAARAAWAEAVREASRLGRGPTAAAVGAKVGEAHYRPGWWQQHSQVVGLVPGTVPETPEQEKARREKERKERRLLERAEYAIRSGNVEPPPEIEHAKWDQLLYQATQTRAENIPNVIDALGHELHILLRHTDPEAVGRYLAEPTNDPDEAEHHEGMIEELREGAAWLARVIEEAERQAPRMQDRE